VAAGRNPSRVAYGTILIGALLAAESGHHEGYPDAILSALVAGLLFWIVHAYTEALGRRLEFQERLTARGLVQALAHEWAIMRGAAVPVLVLLVAGAAGATVETAVNAAVWSAVAAIFVFELAAGVASGARGRELALDAGIGAALGVTILVLKAMLH
jgi:hypothetical protein